MSYYKTGSNQFKKSPKLLANVWFPLAFWIFLIGVFATVNNLNQYESLFKDQPLISPITLDQPVERPDTQTLEGYICTIFGKDCKTALAIARAESHLRAKAKAITDREYSVGLFQINIKSRYAYVHWNRIPGETLKEKEDWLSVPENNVLMAYWIYTKSGWNPWSVFTNGAYQNYL